MSKRKKQDWDSFRAKVAKKRTGNNKEESSTNGLEYLTVQRLSSSVEGKCQKYSRIGPLTMVSLNCEATLQNIKEACKKHFQLTDMECDLLAGEGGHPTPRQAKSRIGKFFTLDLSSPLLPSMQMHPIDHVNGWAEFLNQHPQAQASP